MSPDPRIVPYLEHLRIEGASPYVSTSWKTLGSLYRLHGEDVVQGLLKEWWAHQRVQDGLMQVRYQAYRERRASCKFTCEPFEDWRGWDAHLLKTDPRYWPQHRPA